MVFWDMFLPALIFLLFFLFISEHQPLSLDGNPLLDLSQDFAFAFSTSEYALIQSRGFEC